MNRVDIGGYTGLTSRNSQHVLWHPQCEFFLLGDRITRDIPSELSGPGSAVTAAERTLQ